MPGRARTDAGAMPSLRELFPLPDGVPSSRGPAGAGRARRTGRAGWLAGLLLLGSLAGCSGESVFSTSSTSSAVDPTTVTAATSSTSSTTTATTTTTTVPPTTSTTIPADISAAGTWTVMVYALLDNNLDEYWGLGDFREMREVTEQVPGLTFVALLDRSDQHSNEELGRLGDWTTAKLIDISGGRFKEIDDWGERDLGHPDTLVEFLQAAAAYAPADHYALVFKDHGGGMVVGPDEVPGDNALWNSEIADALGAGLPAAGIGTLDLIAYDACLQASLETASTVHPFASYMVASEDLSYGGAFYYQGFDYLGQAADPTVEGLGGSLLSNHIDFMVQEVGSRGGTLSLLDLRRFAAFEQALAEVVEVARDSMRASAPVFGRRLERVIRFGADPDPVRDFAMVDLGQLLRRVARSDAPVAEAAGRAADLLAEMVVANATGEALAGARGLSVYFPPTPAVGWLQWGDGDNLYDTQGSPVWNSFLEAYFATGRSIPPEQRPAWGPSGPELEYVFDDGWIIVGAQLDPGAAAGVVTAEMWAGVEEPGGSVTFYYSTQGFEGEGPDGAGAYGAVYDLDRLVFSDGTDSAFAFTQISFNEDETYFTLTVPFRYRAPIDPSAGRYADPIDLTLIFTLDMNTGEGSRDFFIANDGTMGPFTPDPQGLLFPLVAQRSPEGEIEWVPSTDVGLWADPDRLAADFPDLPAGTRLRCELTISDYGGHAVTAGVTVTVP